MKEAYRQMRIAEIYATRVDRMMSGDDGEEGLQERLSADLEAFGKEFQAKDWTCSYEDDEDWMNTTMMYNATKNIQFCGKNYFSALVKKTNERIDTQNKNNRPFQRPAISIKSNA